MNAVERVRADYEKKLKEAEREDALREVAPDANRIFVLGKPLYDAIAWVTFGSDDFGKSPCSWSDAVSICERHKPIPAKLVNEGSLSIRPSSCADGSRIRSKVHIAPVWFEVETNASTTIELHWFADTPKGIVRIGVKLGSLHQYSQIASHWIEWIMAPGERLVREQRLLLGDELHAIWDDDGKPVAQVEKFIKWASGGPQYPSRYTVYFAHLSEETDEAEVGLAIVKHMARLSRKEK